MAAKKLLLSILVVVGMGALLLARGEPEEPSAGRMAEAARRFLDTLTEQQRERATFAFDSPERLNWHFIPRERKGIPLKDLTDENRQAAHALLMAGLSESGYEQTLGVMSLEEILYLLEGGEREVRRARRDPENYYFSVFGTPGEGNWGWRFEGHHISLNYTIEDGQVISATPEFFGANPALVDAGPERTIRIMAAEEDIARQILTTCTPDQLKICWIEKEAPDDIRGGGEAQPVVTEPVGLPVAKMSADQKKLMRDLLSEYLKNMPADVEQDRRRRINESGLDGIHFAWWGSDQPNERHAYRVQGETFVIEYNNTQNNANHLHTVWRNLDGDFGVPRKK